MVSIVVTVVTFAVVNSAQVRSCCEHHRNTRITVLPGDVVVSAGSTVVFAPEVLADVTEAVVSVDCTTVSRAAHITITT